MESSKLTVQSRNRTLYLEPFDGLRVGSGTLNFAQLLRPSASISENYPRHPPHRIRVVAAESFSPATEQAAGRVPDTPSGLHKNERSACGPGAICPPAENG